MGKTIKQVSEVLGISVYTLRYYEKEGLIPFLERDKQGNRVYSESNEEWIKMIICLREIGMPVSKLRDYLKLLEKGADTIEERRAFINNYLVFIEKKIEATINCLKITAQKIKQYDNSVADIITDCNILKLYSKINERNDCYDI